MGERGIHVAIKKHIPQFLSFCSKPLSHRHGIREEASMHSLPLHASTRGAFSWSWHRRCFAVQRENDAPRLLRSDWSVHSFDDSDGPRTLKYRRSIRSLGPSNRSMRSTAYEVCTDGSLGPNGPWEKRPSQAFSFEDVVASATTVSPAAHLDDGRVVVG